MRLVEQQQARRGEECARDGDAQPLPAGELHAPLAHLVKLRLRVQVRVRVRALVRGRGGVEVGIGVE